MAEAKPISGKDVLFVMAADAEYGPHLRKRFVPLMTGVGPVEAAVSLGAELGRRSIGSALPALVVSLGSAGSRRLEQTEVYQAVSVSYRDMDASPLGFEKGVTPFLDLPATVSSSLPHRGHKGGQPFEWRSHRFWPGLCRDRGRDGRYGDVFRSARLPAFRRSAGRLAGHFGRSGGAETC